MRSGTNPVATTITPPNSEPTKVRFALFTLDCNGRWLDGGDEWTRITGLNPSESAGRDWVSCLHPICHPQLHQAFLTFIARASRLSEDILLIKGMGSIESPAEARLELTVSDQRRIQGKISVRYGVQFPVVPSLTMETLPEEPSEVDEILAQIKHRLHITIVAALMLLAVGVCLSVVATTTGWAMKKPNATSVRADMAEEKSPAEIMNEAEALLRRFYGPSSPAERLKMTSKGSLPLRYMELNEKPRQLKEVTRRDLMTLDGRPYFTAQAIDDMGGRFLAFVDLSDSIPRVDWEATSGYCEMPLVQFIQEKPQQAVTMRLLLGIGDYYNYHYQDPIRYASFVGQSGDAGQKANLYVNKASPVYERLMKLFSNDHRKSSKISGVSSSNAMDIEVASWRRVTVRLVFEPEGRATEQAIIQDVLATDWVYAGKEDIGGVPVNRCDTDYSD